MVESKILDGLNYEQRSAASVITGPVCINAGPGSGKTRTLTHSIAYRIEQGALPWGIVAITFTNKAKDEIKDRLSKLLGENVARKIFVGTYHAFLSKNVLMPNKKHPAIKKLGYKEGFVIADEDESNKILDEAIKEMPSLMKALFDTCELKNRDVKDFMSKFRASGYFAEDFIQKFGKEEVATKAAYMKIKSNLEILATSPDSSYDIQVVRDAVAKDGKLLDFCKMSAWRSFERRMKNVNAIDYDGMLVLSKYLLEQDSALRKEIAQEIGDILLDEFQDTNNVQWDCIKYLVDEMPSKNILVVGDPDQCIYQFRSANPQIMRDFDTIFPDAQMKYLTTNYRTTSENVELSNVVKAYIDPQNAEHPMKAFNKEGDKPIYRFFKDEKDEASFVIDNIKQLIADGIPKDKISVLYRGKAQRRVVEAALTESHLPYQIVGDISFYETKEVKDAIAMLRMISNEMDVLGFARGISASSISVNGLTMRHEIESERSSGKEITPMSYLYKRFTPKKITDAAREKMLFWIELRKLIDMKKGITEEEYIYKWMLDGYKEAESPLAETLTIEEAINTFNSVKDQGVLHPLFFDDMAKERERYHAQVVETLREFYDKYYLEKLKAYSLKNDMRVPEQQEQRLQERIDNVGQLFNTLHSKLMDNGDFENAINELMLLTEQAEENVIDGVQLMTVHASKGLEFDTVFLIGTEQRSYFSQSSMERDYESEACAFFVATSRAERLNIITGAKGRTINGQYDNNSDELVFVKRLPSHVYDNHTDMSVKAGLNDEVETYSSEINQYGEPAKQKGAGVIKKPDGRVDLQKMIRSM